MYLFCRAINAHIRVSKYEENRHHNKSLGGHPSGFTRAANHTLSLKISLLIVFPPKGLSKSHSRILTDKTKNYPKKNTY